ncbi:DUF5682 family protein [Streptomyces sp. YS415]|uniref:DUF5682 family protein n=1 Tax=Streptomyces sp. YS415 TaxID=2944806 RepID=UPI002020EDBE|nr:DUF5682 family protein [Streptomyces sp. YS415]MCL7428556.1 DUF5682 family protein [Streptomyces sp. YS415]
MSSAVFLGVRHHSPACARLVARAIATLRPAYVLVEGPADMNGRLDELLLEHRLPIAVFSHYRDASRVATSWAPLCDYSPEWIALREGRAAGAEVRFIDLPAWHPAFTQRAEGAANRYADAEARYAEATGRLCAHFSVDSVDALWDRLFEVTGPDDADALQARLDAYFDLVRGDAEADAGDRAREEYMASWVSAAVAHAAGRPVLVVTGGFHTPALRSLAQRGDPVRAMVPGLRAGLQREGSAAPREGAGPEDRAALQEAAQSEDPAAPQESVEPEGTPAPRKGAPPEDAPAAYGMETPWPRIPEPPEGALGGSFLVPYSFRQLDAFAGYQSGMPSPGYYQRLWEHGPRDAAQGLLRAVAERLRGRRVPVSTANLVAARGLAQGLALLRGHPYETRVDVLDGLAGALIADDLDRPLPWTTRGSLHAGAHPVVAEMVAACTGDAEGRLHPDTPLPPLVHDVTEQLARLGLADAEGGVTLDLADPSGLARSRVLHRLRVLGIPGFTRVSGPADGADPVFTERWEPDAGRGGREAVTAGGGREAALIEAGAYGARLDEAASVLLAERAEAAGRDAGPLAGLLFDAVLCGVGPLCAELLDRLAAQVGRIGALGPLGEVLASALGLWRHDRVFGAARGELLGGVVAGAVERVFWLAEGLHGGDGVDLGRLGALAAARDALLHAPDLLPLTREAAADAAARIARDPLAPADLRGAAFGLRRTLGGADDPAAVVRTLAPGILGDWLAGLFAVAREEVTGGAESLVDVLDDIVAALPEDGFLTGLPALRQAFAFFPPRERERIAERLLQRRGTRGSARALLRTTADPLQLARARALEENVARLLTRHGLRSTP